MRKRSHGAAREVWDCPDVSPQSPALGPVPRPCWSTEGVSPSNLSVNKGDEAHLWQCLAWGGGTQGLPPPHPASPICVLWLCPAVPKPEAFLEKNVKAVEFRRMWRLPLARSAGGAAGVSSGAPREATQKEPWPRGCRWGWQRR